MSGIATKIEKLTERVEQAETKANELKDKNTELESKVEELEKEKIALVTSNGKAYGRRSDSIEAKALDHFGCKHPQELFSINTADPRYNWVSNDVKGYVRQLKSDLDVARWVSQLYYGEPQDTFTSDRDQEKIVTVKGILDHNFGKDVLAGKLKALGTEVEGGGAEWLNIAISSSYIEELELDRRVESLFRQMPMPSKEYTVPKVKGLQKARRIGEKMKATPTNVGTTNLKLNAEKFVEYVEMPEEVNEDTAPPILALHRMEAIESQERAIEAGIISGDATLNTDKTSNHMDSDSRDLNLSETAWHGLRKLAIDNGAFGGVLDLGGNPISQLALRRMRAQMGKYGTSPRNLVWLVGTTAYQHFLSLPGVVTVDKITATFATILRGSLAAFDGIPIVISEWMREDLNESGVYDGTSMDRLGIILVNTSRFMTGLRRPIMTRIVQDLPGWDQTLIGSYQRKAFAGCEQDADEVSVVYGINGSKDFVVPQTPTDPTPSTLLSTIQKSSSEDDTASPEKTTDTVATQKKTSSRKKSEANKNEGKPDEAQA